MDVETSKGPFHFEPSHTANGPRLRYSLQRLVSEHWAGT